MPARTLRRTATALTALAFAALASVTGSGVAAAQSSDTDSYVILGNKSVENISVARSYRTSTEGDTVRGPGDLVEVTTAFYVSSGPGEAVTAVTEHHPGLEYLPRADGTIRVNVVVQGPYIQPTIDVVPVVSPDGSTVSFTLPGDGLPSADYGWNTGFTYEMTYRVPLDAPVGATLDNGVTFHATGLDGEQGWPAMGVTPITVGSEPTGSIFDSLLAGLSGS